MASNIICPFKEPFVHIEMHFYCTTLSNYKLNVVNKIRFKSYEIFLPWPVWLAWLEHCLIKTKKIVGSIPEQGTCLGYGFSPQLGHIQEALIDVSVSYQCLLPSLSPSIPLSLNQ